MRKIIVIIPLFLGFPNPFLAQNLVPDSSFEVKESCPYAISELHKLKYWWSPIATSPDFFCNCEKGKWKNSTVEASDNFVGTQDPRSGYCYAGFIVYNSSQPSYREYVQTRLTEELEKGKSYHVSFYLSVAEYCKYQLDSAIGMYFSKDSVFYTSYKPLVKFIPQIKSVGLLENSTVSWFRISGVYVAEGGERFITIGGFNKLKQKARKYKKSQSSLDHGWKQAYYYIDDVSV